VIDLKKKFKLPQLDYKIRILDFLRNKTTENRALKKDELETLVDAMGRTNLINSLKRILILGIEGMDEDAILALFIAKGFNVEWAG
jgi:hypothetical protein